MSTKTFFGTKLGNEGNSNNYLPGINMPTIESQLKNIMDTPALNPLTPDAILGKINTNLSDLRIFLPNWLNEHKLLVIPLGVIIITLIWNGRRR